MSGIFSLSDGSRFSKNMITFVADMNSSAHVDNRKKDSSILRKSPTQGLDETPLTTEK